MEIAVQNLTLVNVAANTFFFAGEVKTRRKGIVKYNWDKLRKAVAALPLSSWQTICGLSAEIGVPQSTIHRLLKEERCLRRLSSTVKPNLTDENKVARMIYALDKVHPVPNEEGKYHFKDQFDRVDVDEKWFYLTNVTNNYIMVASDSENEEEAEPTRRTRHKSHIEKILFLCAQAKPHYDPNRKCEWDGKIGIWPIGDFVPAKQTTKKRKVGTLVWRNKNVTKDVYRRISMIWSSFKLWMHPTRYRF